MSGTDAHEGENATYRIVETGQRVNGLELELHLILDRWRVRDHRDGR